MTEFVNEQETTRPGTEVLDYHTPCEQSTHNNCTHFHNSSRKVAQSSPTTIITNIFSCPIKPQPVHPTIEQQKIKPVDKTECSTHSHSQPSYLLRHSLPPLPPLNFQHCYFYGRDKTLPQCGDIVVGVVRSYGQIGHEVSLVEYGYRTALVFSDSLHSRRDRWRWNDSDREKMMMKRLPMNTLLPFTVVRVDHETGEYIVCLFTLQFD